MIDISSRFNVPGVCFHSKFILKVHYIEKCTEVCFDYVDLALFMFLAMLVALHSTPVRK